MNTKTVFIKIVLKNRLKPLTPVFAELRSVHEEYNNYEIPDGDYTFWYRERPQVGMLAAAVCRIPKGAALEEYKTRKLKNGEEVNGRCDLWIRIDEKTEFECEAKHRHLTLGKNEKKMAKKALSVLNDAINDSEKLTHAKSSRLALGFVTVKIKGKDKDDYKHRVDTLLNSLKTSCDALFWISTPKGFEDEDKRPKDLHGLIFMVRKTK